MKGKYLEWGSKEVTHLPRIAIPQSIFKDRTNEYIKNKETEEAIKSYSELRSIYIKLIKLKPNKKIKHGAYNKIKRAYQSLKEILKVMQKEKELDKKLEGKWYL